MPTHCCVPGPHLGSQPRPQQSLSKYLFECVASFGPQKAAFRLTALGKQPPANWGLRSSPKAPLVSCNGSGRSDSRWGNRAELMRQPALPRPAPVLSPLHNLGCAPSTHGHGTCLVGGALGTRAALQWVRGWDTSFFSSSLPLLVTLDKPFLLSWGAFPGTLLRPLEEKQ